MENDIYPVNSVEDALNIHEVSLMCSFDSIPTISKNNLIHLLEGKPLVDLNDGEYVHWIQLDKEALSFVKNNIRFTK